MVVKCEGWILGVDLGGGGGVLLKEGLYGVEMYFLVVGLVGVVEMVVLV